MKYNSNQSLLQTSEGKSMELHFTINNTCVEEILMRLTRILTDLEYIIFFYLAGDWTYLHLLPCNYAVQIKFPVVCWGTGNNRTYNNEAYFMPSPFYNVNISRTLSTNLRYNCLFGYSSKVAFLRFAFLKSQSISVY